MNVWPVVEREIRQASRQAVTFAYSIVVPLTGLLVGGFVTWLMIRRLERRQFDFNREVT